MNNYPSNVGTSMNMDTLRGIVRIRWRNHKMGARENNGNQPIKTLSQNSFKNKDIRKTK